ncbi:hypothetical protein [Sphingopyxis sp.]|uniref:hypothetical protein n=1 Tax=Sphingopyxis sp. TaxID=1908224 RepID=UPI0025CF39B5|nr:hypothetical protein [Sphingopyxis sp.]
MRLAAARDLARRFWATGEVDGGVSDPPGYRPDGLALIRRVLPQQYAANDATPAAVIGRDARAFWSTTTRARETPPLAKLMTLDWAQLKPVLADGFAKGAIEIGVVRDIDEQAAIDAIAASFRALPERRAAFNSPRGAGA